MARKLVKKANRNNTDEWSVDCDPVYDDASQETCADEPEGAWQPYVSKRQRRVMAAAETRRMRDEGVTTAPIHIVGGAIASRPWGRAWCKNLELFCEFASRLPTGRSDVRQGAVLHLEMAPGVVRAKVQGSDLYAVEIQISLVEQAVWENLRKLCHGRIASLVELIEGRLDDEIMGLMVQPGTGLLPTPEDSAFRCSCPDPAIFCQHVAAALYGVGHRLDQAPEMLFQLRGVDPGELIGGALASLAEDMQTFLDTAWDDSELADLFGIDVLPPQF